MIGIALTTSQLAAAALAGPPLDTCVVAGPGSGKTTVLIERFRRLVASGISPQRILAITFTEKATLEMRRRLMKAFADNVEVRRGIERAYVSTVHGFCARLLKEYSIAAGVDPEYRLLGEQESLALERNAAADALDAYYREHAKPMRALLGAMATPDLAGALVEVHQAMRAAGTTPEDLRRSTPRPDAEAVLTGLCGVFDEIGRENTRGWTAGQQGVLREFQEWAGRVRELSGQPLSMRHFEALTAGIKLRGLKQNTRAYALIREISKQRVDEVLGDLAAAWYAPQRETLLGALEKFAELHRTRKREAGALDFSNLEEYAVQLLEENSWVRDRVRGQFDQILMDEFQDTNGLQSRLLELLRAPDRFYAVGDINQSIYGFRHAEPEVFRAYRDHVRDGGKRLRELRENWRSRPGILLAVEAVTGATPGVEPRELIAGRAFAAKSRPSVEVISCIGADPASGVRLEAQWVARRILELREELGFDYRAFALLFRSSTPMSTFSVALEEAGVPFVTAAGKGFFEAQEVTDLIHLLGAIANPLDEVSLAAVLRSPLCGVSDETLLRMRERENLADALEQAPDFAARLKEYRAVKDHVTADRLLLRAMDDTGYEAALTPRGRANVEKFVTLAREGSGRRTLDAFVDELTVLRDVDPRESDTLGGETGNYVRLQTIHSAKGLEFPVVFLPAIQAPVQSDKSAIAFSPRRGGAAAALGVKWRNPASRESVEDSLFRVVSREARRKAAEESDRLLYVAMTRAEEHLVLSCSSGGRAYGNWAKYVEEKLTLPLRTPLAGPAEQKCFTPDGREFKVRLLVTNAAPETTPAERTAADETAAPEWVHPPEVSGQHDSSASVTSVALFTECPRRYYLERYLGWEAPRPSPRIDSDAAKPDALDATELGLQVHALLAGDAVEDADPEAVRLAERFHASALGLRAAATLLAEREFDFLFAIEDVVLRGQIDLWFEESGELVLVDYKTDAKPDADRARHYALQLQLYAVALEKQLGKLPDRAFLYFLRPDEALEVRVDREAAGEAVAAVRRFREAQENMDFPLREGERCRTCPFYQRSCPAYVSGFSSMKGSG